MLHALIHRARLVTRPLGVRNEQGERVVGEPVPGPWFRCRVMERGGPAAKSRRRPDGSDARVARGYELLAAPVDVNGDPVVLSASDEVETDCPILGSPRFELAGRPEKLTDGRRHIGWLAFSVDPGDAA